MAIERQGLKEVILAKMGQTLGQMAFLSMAIYKE
jgi:hypothetical protein